MGVQGYIDDNTIAGPSSDLSWVEKVHYCFGVQVPNRLPCMLNETRSIEASFVHSGLDADQLCKVLLELMVN